VSDLPTMPADDKAAYARRAEAVAVAFVYGNDWQRLSTVWDLLTHHGLRLTWPVLRDEFLRAAGVGPTLPWPTPTSNPDGVDEY
jgi:hypothetical protein